MLADLLLPFPTSHPPFRSSFRPNPTRHCETEPSSSPIPCSCSFSSCSIFFTSVHPILLPSLLRHFFFSAILLISRSLSFAFPFFSVFCFVQSPLLSQSRFKRADFLCFHVFYLTNVNNRSNIHRYFNQLRLLII